MVKKEKRSRLRALLERQDEITLILLAIGAVAYFLKYPEVLTAIFGILLAKYGVEQVAKRL